VECLSPRGGSPGRKGMHSLTNHAIMYEEPLTTMVGPVLTRSAVSSGGACVDEPWVGGRQYPQGGTPGGGFVFIGEVMEGGAGISRQSQGWFCPRHKADFSHVEQQQHSHDSMYWSIFHFVIINLLY
jgi:hypothetical protein